MPYSRPLPCCFISKVGYVLVGKYMARYSAMNINILLSALFIPKDRIRNLSASCLLEARQETKEKK